MISNLGRTPLIATFIEISLVIHSHSIPIYNCYNYRIFVSVFVDIDIVNFFIYFLKIFFCLRGGFPTLPLVFLHYYK